MNKREKHILCSTHRDKHGDILELSALECVVDALNGKRKPRLGLEHDRTIPPYGVMMNGEIIHHGDAYYVTAEENCFDRHEYLELEDGTVLIKSSFKDGKHPLVEGEIAITDKVTVLVDRVNFASREDLDSFFRVAQNFENLGVETGLFGRKSEIPPPELLIQVTEQLSYWFLFYRFLLKPLEKEIEASATELLQFIKKSGLEAIRNMRPSNRPVNFVIDFPVEGKMIVELVVSTRNIDDVLLALQQDKLSAVKDKLQCLMFLKPEKVQFLYGDGEWEFNYMIDTEGRSYGTEKSLKRRDDVLKNYIRARQEAEQAQLTSEDLNREQ